MKYELPKLPFKRDSLKPHISEETIEYHYGKHHQAYVDKLNELIQGTKNPENLTELVKTSTGTIFNQAAQHWNHSFYWECLTPNGGGQPSGDMLKAIEDTFGSFYNFSEEFKNVSTTLFGSGWTWLVVDKNGAMSVMGTKDAGNPLTEGYIPLLTCDVWEHAYYIDYRNEKPKYVDAFFELINWEFVTSNYINVGVDFEIT